MENSFDDNRQKSSVMNRALRQKLKNAYRNPSLSLPHDVTFRVMSKCGLDEPSITWIGAHSFVLAMSSPVLDSLITNHLRDSDGRHLQIKVSRGDERTVECFLEFLYCGKADLSDFNYQEIMDVVALADEYKIGDVIAKSSEDLVKLVNVKNAVAVLEFLSSLNCKSSSDCVQYDASFSKCFNFIIRHAKEIVGSESFMDLRESNLRLILSSDYLIGVSEVDLFEACLKWGQSKCERRHFPPTTENLRAVLSELLHYIRFPLMSPDEFSWFVLPKDILSKEELTDILVFFSVSDLNKWNLVPKFFSTTPRVMRLDSFNEKCSNGSSVFNRFLQVSSQMQPSELINLSSSLKDYLDENNEHFVIFNHKLHWNELISRLAHEIPSRRRQRIRSFILENVQLVDFIDSGGKLITKKIVRLPVLKEFILNLSCKKEEAKAMANFLKTNFSQFIFFTTRAKQCCPEALWGLDIDIVLKLNGVTFLEISHKNNSLVVNGLEGYMKVLESCKNEDIQSLSIALENSRSTLSYISTLTRLTKLCIHNASSVSRVGQLLHQLPIANLGSLSELILHKCEFHVVDLKLLEQLESLRKVAISYANVIATKNGEETGEEDFQINLRSFTLWNCSWNGSLLKRLGQWKNLQRLIVNNEEVSSRKLWPFLNLFSKEKTPVKDLIIVGCLWGINGTDESADHQQSGGISSQYDDEELRQVRDLLERLNVSKNKVRLRLSNPLKTDGTLVAEEQKCEVLSEEMLTKLMFEGFGCEAFFESVSRVEEHHRGQ